jgi:hypothetical protein
MATDPDQREPVPAKDELKETADLLAGFDRPARKPAAPRAENRDFVDFHVGKRRATPEMPVLVDRPLDERRNLPTALVTVRQARSPRWWIWAAVLAMMTSAGVLVTALAFRVRPPASLPSASEARSTAPTTFTSEAKRGATDDIPDPPPPASSTRVPTENAPSVKRMQPRSPDPSESARAQPVQPPASKSPLPPSSGSANVDIDLIRNL